MRPVSTLCLAAGLAAGFTFTMPAMAAEQPGASRSAVDRLDQRVRRLENVLDSGQLVDLIRRIDSLNEEIRELRGAIETQAHRLDELRERQRRLYGDLDRRLREVEVAGRQRRESEQNRQDEQDAQDEAAAGDDEQAPGLGGQMSGAERAEVEGGGSSEGEDESDAATEAEQREEYNAAFDLLKDGRYEAAAEAFGEFLDAHPQGPYSDNAQYWLGEARYVRRDFEGALEAFRQTAERYPESTKVPDARLKIGYTLHELQRYDEARAVLKELIAEHGDGTVARLAEERLLRLERQRRQANGGD